MDSYQCSYGPTWTTPVSYPTQYFVHKENPACRKCGFAHHVWNCVAQFMCFKCGKNGHLARMCMAQKINRLSDVHAIKVAGIARHKQTKENPRKKFNATETGSDFSTKNAYYLQNFLFPGLKTLNSMKSLLRINWMMRSRK